MAVGDARASSPVGDPSTMPVFEYTSDALIQQLRRALADPLAVMSRSTRTPGKSVASAEATYVCVALDVLEQLTSQMQPSQTLQIESVELADVLMQLLAEWKTKAPHHSLELALLGESPIVLADDQTVTQVARLLLEAAINLAPDGGGVRVSLRAHGDGALIGIHQAETQLPADRIAGLFDPFPELPELDAAQRTALLPLAVARQLIERHSGCAWVEAAPQAGGTIFYTWWPTTPSVRPASELPATSLPPVRLPLHRAKPVALILEGDARMARYLRANLEARGYQASSCESEADAVKLIDREEPDLLLIDGGLPSMDDASLLIRLRQYASAPIIVLGQSAEPQLCARMLDAGASDYLPRPFNVEELLARIRAALRSRQASSGAEPNTGVVTTGALEIDLANQQVRESGRLIALSRTEYRLLRALAQHHGKVVSHTQLLERVWGAGYGHETEFLWVYVRRLRRKIEPDPAHPRYILTASGVGYQLAETSVASAVSLP